MEQQNLGGISLKEVITFQTQIMLGAQFGRVMKATDQDDIIIACLRMGWNDAFRHTSRNKKDKDKVVLEEAEKEWRKNHKEPHDDFICGSILNQTELLSAFAGFAQASSTADKVNVIQAHYPALEKRFEKYKETSGNQGLCFGHFQKMFNIAIKLYVCLYLCRGWLDLDGSLFDEDIISNIQNADCPIDSIILGNLADDTKKREYRSHKWSQYGTEDHPIEHYQDAQNAISNLEETNGKSNLYYDFVAWNRERLFRQDDE